MTIARNSAFEFLRYLFGCTGTPIVLSRHPAKQLDLHIFIARFNDDCQNELKTEARKNEGKNEQHEIAPLHSYPFSVGRYGGGGLGRHHRWLSVLHVSWSIN